MSWYTSLIAFYSPPIFGDIVKAVAGPIVGGLFGQEGQEEANKANAKQAALQMEFQREQNQKAMDFSERMSNTAYQRGMKDMQKAGLNPMLAFMKGGASAPSGVTSSGAMARYENTQAQLASGLSNVNLANVENIVANTAKQTAEADVAKAEADEIRARTPTHEANILYTKALTDKVGPEIQKLLSSSALDSVNYNKVIEEIPNLVAQRHLTMAQVKEALARADLTREQINEVAPRINEIVTRTRDISAQFGFSEAKGSFGDMVNLPKIINSAGASHPIKGINILNPVNNAMSMGNAIERAFDHIVNSAKASMRENRLRYEANPRR